MKLSIITVNLNNAEGLRKTIESVVTQTFIISLLFNLTIAKNEVC